MTKDLKHLKTLNFTALQCVHLSFDECFIVVGSSHIGFKIQCQLTGLHSMFGQNFNLRIKHGFSCINVRKVHQEMFKTEGVRFGCYRGKLDH